ncbi:hypothetical protein EG328_010334 [Venturia inaequalis]|uniref:Uncharacterized protein n=1 Tax=Venturia inaequalis TaxID=5025 RepID=A0A8H3U7R4_VENIN|nr:hypothetical protein EG328_010334 [Venturia inaequalis]
MTWFPPTRSRLNTLTQNPRLRTKHDGALERRVLVRWRMENERVRERRVLYYRDFIPKVAGMMKMGDDEARGCHLDNGEAADYTDFRDAVLEREELLKGGGAGFTDPPRPRRGATRTGRLKWEIYRRNLVNGEMEIDESLVRHRLRAEWGGVQIPRGWKKWRNCFSGKSVGNPSLPLLMKGDVGDRRKAAGKCGGGWAKVKRKYRDGVEGLTGMAMISEEAFRLFVEGGDSDYAMYRTLLGERKFLLERGFAGFTASESAERAGTKAGSLLWQYRRGVQGIGSPQDKSDAISP